MYGTLGRLCARSGLLRQLIIQSILLYLQQDAVSNYYVKLFNKQITQYNHKLQTIY